MPTGNEDLNAALAQAQRICWDESIGYELNHNFDPDCDCSAFVWRCLHDNGFDVGSSRFSTLNEAQVLTNAGFTQYVWGVDTTTPEHGDIFMYDEGGGANGHTFFIANNVWGYKNGHLGWENCNGVIAQLSQAKIEAAGSHHHPEHGDQDNGLGAHTEVWVHSFANGDPTTGSHTWYIFRWGSSPPVPPPPGPPPGPYPPGHLPYWLIKKIHDRNFTKYKF